MSGNTSESKTALRGSLRAEDVDRGRASTGEDPSSSDLSAAIFPISIHKEEMIRDQFRKKLAIEEL